MARPRSNKLQGKGKGTTFGKQSDAEKAFYKRGKTSRFDDSKRSSGPDEEKKSSRPGPASFRRGDSKPPFKKRSTAFGESSSYRSDRDKPGSRPERDDQRGKRPFRKSGDDSYRPRPDGPPKFTRSGRGGDESSHEKKPFQKRDSSFHSRPEGPPKFTRSSRPGGDSEFKKPFGKGRPDSPKPRTGPPSFSRSRRSDSESGERPERKSFVQSRVIKSGEFTKRVRSEEKEPKKDDGLIRLNKFIANAGIGSRRQADELIKMGLISVNGTAITVLGTKVKMDDVVKYEDRVLKAEKPVYVLLNKPKGFITTTDDPQERSTVMGLVAGACKERIYPVGRLDRNTTGLLLLTNDGDLADKLTHPSYKAKKVYKAELDRPLTKNDLAKISEGVHLEEGRAVVDDVAILSDDNKTVGLEIHIGWNRVVRRIFEALGYEVVKLDRSVFAGLDKKDLSRGQWRFLKPEEVVRLKHFK